MALDTRTRLAATVESGAGAGRPDLGKEETGLGRLDRGYLNRPNEGELE